MKPINSDEFIRQHTEWAGVAMSLDKVRELARMYEARLRAREHALASITATLYGGDPGEVPETVVADFEHARRALTEVSGRLALALHGEHRPTLPQPCLNTLVGRLAELVAAAEKIREGYTSGLLEMAGYCP